MMITQPLPTIHTYSPEALGPQIITMNGTALKSVATTAWSINNLALFVPFQLCVPIVVAKLWIANGTSVGGNIDIGIYDTTGTKIISSGSTAQSGTSTIQAIDIPDTLLNMGGFYMALALSSTTGQVLAGSVTAALRRVLGMVQQESAFPLPGTATFATTTGAPGIIPLFGLLLSPRTVI